MRKFTKEISALLATLAVGASATAATAASEDAVRTAGVALNQDCENDTYTEGVAIAETTTTTAASTTPMFIGTTVYRTSETTAPIETMPTIGTMVYDPKTTTTSSTTSAPIYTVGTTYIAAKSTTTSTTTTSAPTETPLIGTTINDHSIMYGDVNIDQRVSVADSVTILQHIGNKDKYPLSNEAKECGDCYNTGDGLTANDALTIQKIDAGLISETDLPVMPK